MEAYASGVRGQVRILASVSAMAESLADDVAAFLQMAAHRNIQVDLEERVSPEIVRGVRDGAASLGVCWDAADLGPLQSRGYRSDHLCMVVPPKHPLASRKSLRFAQTLDYEHVSLPVNSAVQVMLQRAAAQLGRKLNQRVVVSNFEAALRVVRAGLAISLVPLEVAEIYAAGLWPDDRSADGALGRTPLHHLLIATRRRFRRRRNCWSIISPAAPIHEPPHHPRAGPESAHPFSFHRCAGPACPVGRSATHARPGGDAARRRLHRRDHARAHHVALRRSAGAVSVHGFQGGRRNADRRRRRAGGRIRGDGRGWALRQGLLTRTQPGRRKTRRHPAGHRAQLRTHLPAERRQHRPVHLHRSWARRAHPARARKSHWKNCWPGATTSRPASCAVAAC